jgi:subtilisin
MARSRARTPRPSPQSPPPITGVGPEPTGDFTGRYLVLLRDDGIKEGLQAVQGATGLSEVCNAADFTSAAVEMAQANEADVFVLDKLKVAVVDADPTQVSGLRSAASEDGAILAVEPERIMYALAGPTDPFATQFPFEYLRGYKDAVNHLYASLIGGTTELEAELAAAGFADNGQFTWGLQATQTSQSRPSGRGIRVAMLDTGFDLDHLLSDERW